MADERNVDDASHYEISLTAGQAFVAFVLLLLSLAASFAFGIVVGRAGEGERLVTQREPLVIREEARESGGETIVELGVPEKREETPVVTEEPPVSDPAPADPQPQPGATAPPVDPPMTITPPQRETPAQPSVPHFAQLLSTSDARAAETLAARLIEEGFTSAYVERTRTDGTMIYRVRVRFLSEAAARAAAERLSAFTPGEIWIARE